VICSVAIAQYPKSKTMAIITVMEDS